VKPPVVYTLADPIEITEVGTGRVLSTIAALTIREPRGADIMECGNPFDLVMGEGKADHRVIGALLVRLANEPPSTIKALSLTDWNGCTAALIGFLGVPGKISPS
jgi:hypothetical protein